MSTDHTPADPPGLDAAIEAAVQDAVDRGWQTAHDIEHNVRAAAPALRAGALREAADELSAISASGHQTAVGWLRERADRIGGAT